MKIGYWGIRGKGHPVRNLAHYLDLPFEDKRYSNPDDWFAKDKKELNIPFPNLPYLIDGEFNLTETRVIMKYLCVKAKKEEMLGKTLMDQIQIEQVEGVFNDQLEAIYSIISTNDDIATYEKTYNEKLFPKLQELNNYFEKNKFIGKDNLCWADFAACEFLDFAQAIGVATIKVNIFEKYPNIDKYFQNFMQLPKVKEFYSKEDSKVGFLQPEYLKINL